MIKTHCGGVTCFGHGEYQACGQPNGYRPQETFQCVGCKLKDAEKEIDLLKTFVRSVRNELLMPLSQEPTSLGRVADGFGQFTVSLLDES